MGRDKALLPRPGLLIERVIEVVRQVMRRILITNTPERTNTLTADVL
jgi:molybdopterin-guanine dinucleotide biosynthesis protein A